MSKIGKKPIKIPEGVTVDLKDGYLAVKGKLGELKVPVLEFVKAEINDGVIKLLSLGADKQARANWGTMGALIQNAIVGVKDGYTKILEIEGIGFKAALEGKNLVLNIRFSHPVKSATPEGVAIVIEKGIIKISGQDKSLVGEVAAQIRRLRKPEPYKGTGIRYKGEVIRRKAGKKVAGSGTGAA